MSDLQTQNSYAGQNLKDKLSEAGTEIKQRAGEALDTSTGVAKETFTELTDAAKDVASHAVETVQKEVSTQQHASADYISRFAENIRASSRAFEQDAPFAARGIGLAADFVTDAADKLRGGSFGELVDGATSFAKRQPAAFLGLSVLAGFAAIRFLKAGGEGQLATQTAQYSGQNTQPNGHGAGGPNGRSTD